MTLFTRLFHESYGGRCLRSDSSIPFRFNLAPARRSMVSFGDQLRQIGPNGTFLGENTHTHYACLRCALRAPLRLRWSSWLVCSTGCDSGEKNHSSRVGLTVADLEICAAQVLQHSKRSPNSKRSLRGKRSPGSKRSLSSKRSLRGKRSLRCKNVKVL